MSKVEMKVRQIIELGLWEKVCEHKGWEPHLLNDGRIDYDDSVEFDTTFPKDTRTEVQKLAEDLHDTMCTWNHIDGCGWWYEDWSGSTHAKYLERAEKIMKLLPNTSTYDIIEVLKIAKEL